MRYEEIAHLRRNHPAWELLAATNVAFVLSFLGRVFVDPNAGDLPASALVTELDDELYALRERVGDDALPRDASAYLDEWAARGWLRKHYPPATDEAHFGLTPAVEKALLWVRGLRRRDFVGTESRLNTIFDLLRQMVHGSETDPQRRLEQLRHQRARLDEEIARAERGDIDVLDAVGQRDRYQQFTRIARELLADFREVEENFRLLDRQLRRRIASWAGSKGELLDEVLSARSSIAESDQGRSFQAFFDFLLSAQRRDELSELLQGLERIEAITDRDVRLFRIHFDWIDASERTQATVRLVSEQLRRFLDDQVSLEHRRLYELFHNIKTKALELRDAPCPPVVMELEATKLTPVLPTERPLHRVDRRTPPLDGGPLLAGVSGGDSSALDDVAYVDRAELARHVVRALGDGDHVALEAVVEDRPLRQGLAELVGYLSLHEPGLDVVFDDDATARIAWAAEDAERVATLPRVTFSRDHTEDP